MALPKWIPKQYRALMTSFRPATAEDDIDDILFLSQEQTEAQLQKQMGMDKVRAVKKIAIRISRKKDFIKQAKGNAKKMLQEQLIELEEKQFELLRDEILNAVKDSAGLIDEAKLAKVPGSSAFIKKNLKRNKPKN